MDTVKQVGMSEAARKREAELLKQGTNSPGPKWANGMTSLSPNMINC